MAGAHVLLFHLNANNEAGGGVGVGTGANRKRGQLEWSFFSKVNIVFANDGTIL